VAARLCSGGSGATPFPTFPAHMRPSDSLTPFGLGSGSPRRWPTSWPVSSSWPDSCVHPQNAGPSEIGARLPVGRHFTRRRQGLPGYWVVLFIRAGDKHPARTLRDQPAASLRHRLRPTQRLGHPGLIFSGLTPPAHMFVCLRIAEAVVANGARLTTGLSGCTLAGSVSHQLDDVLVFKESSLPPIPPGQHCLVALGVDPTFRSQKRAFSRPAMPLSQSWP
jgi:hypothetical protein